MTVNNMDRIEKDLVQKFKELTPYVYLEPPANIHLKYPCVIITYSYIRRKNALGQLYSIRPTYNILYITRNDEVSGVITNMLSKFPTLQYDSRYTSDGLTHVSMTYRDS